MAPPDNQLRGVAVAEGQHCGGDAGCEYADDEGQCTDVGPPSWFVKEKDEEALRRKVEARRKLKSTLKPRKTEICDLRIPHCLTVKSRGEIAAGGFGSIHLLVGLPDVVMKRVTLGTRFKPSARERANRITLREVRLIKAIGPHPNIISFVTEPTISRKYLEMIMPRYDGTLHEYIHARDEDGYVSGVGHVRAAEIMRQLMGALAACHKVDVIHRDIKPDNILMDRLRGTIVLTDFGLAKRMTRSGAVKPGWARDEDSDLTSESDSDGEGFCAESHEAKKRKRAQLARSDIFPKQEVVTLGYRAPEIVCRPTGTKVRYGPEIDVFAAGCVYAEMVSGRRTFEGITTETRAEMKAYGEKFCHFYAYVTLARHRIFPGTGKWLAFMPSEFDVWVKMIEREPLKRATAQDSLAGFESLCGEFDSEIFMDVVSDSGGGSRGSSSSSISIGGISV